MASKRDIARALLERHGRTYAQQAGVRLRDGPSSLYQLLVVSMLLSARIRADIATNAASELFAAGYRSPRSMHDATWQHRVDALGRGGYRRYDERTATMLGDGAALVQERWRGDLRRIRTEAGERVRGRRTPAAMAGAVGTLLQEVPGIGPTGAAIFCREVQGLWPEVAPYVDKLAARGAERVGLPSDPKRLAAYAEHSPDLPHLVSACVRAALSQDVARDVTAA